MNQEKIICQNCKQEFTIEPEDFDFYEKIKVPPPTFCPECRLIRRLSWRNERSLYKRKCDLTGENIISVFAPDKPYTVYGSKVWWSDDWDPFEYGIKYDPAVPFVKQFDALLKRVPLMNLFGFYTSLVNSDFTNMVSYLKNCYMVTYSDVGENLIYGSFVNRSKDCVDNLILLDSELCYECVNCLKCYRVLFSHDCESCNDVYFSKNCVGCSNCFGCANLRNQKYQIFNVQYSKEEYDKKFVDVLPLTREKIDEYRKEAEKHWLKYPQKYYHGTHNVNVSGEYVGYSKNTKNSFLVVNTEDSKYCTYIGEGNSRELFDFTSYGTTSELIYETLQAGEKSSRVFFSWWVAQNVRNIEYSVMISGGHDLFGCVGLRKAEYCILNKQYTKEEYEKLRAEIVVGMNKNPYIDKAGRVYKYGEFFPSEISPFGYNETTAGELFSLPKNKVLEKSFNWYEKEPNTYKSTLSAGIVPKTINDTPDSILNEVIECKETKRGFKIIKSELDFYRKMKLPIPVIHPDVRHTKRIKYRNPFKLWNRACMCDRVGHNNHEGKCRVRFESSYAPDRPEIIYCEQCYQQEVY
jgi:hypothetical protein